MTPEETLLAVRRHGAALSVGDDGKLHVRGGKALPEDVKRALREYGPCLLELPVLAPSEVAPGVQRLYWQAFDHVCSTACQRPHPVCNACAQPLGSRWSFWPWLHGNCTLELVEAES